MKIIRGLPMPDLSNTRSRYNFQDLKHGDAIMVERPNSMLEMFRRWRRNNHLPRSAARMIYAGENEEGLHVFFFNTESAVQTVKAAELESDEI